MSEAELKLIMMNEVQEQAVEWLWYPYIPFGKITVVQGDPGDGKTTFVLALTALLTNGKKMLESNKDTAPSLVIYQTAEDGLADTIKPRLTALEANCSRVVVIDESERDLTLIDERIEQAINETSAKLFIIDPLQAYLGVNVDMHRANEIRPVFKSLAGVAERTGCAIMILGHMNKMSGAVKGLYRGLGSIDIAAAARSILLIGRVKDSPTMRIMAHLKSSLAQEGQSIAFDIGGDTGRFAWIGPYNISAEELLNGSGQGRSAQPTKKDKAMDMLQELLTDGAMPCQDIYEYFDDADIGRRTVDNAKKDKGIVSFKKGAIWYWKLP